MVAQLASVLGREFDYALLHAICGCLRPSWNNGWRR